MKIALVHELLTMRGGAERVAKIVAEMYPDAPIYTLLYNERLLGEWFPASRVRTSSIQKKAERLRPVIGSSAFNHHLYLKQMPGAVEAWDFSEYDVVLSMSSAFAHGIITNGKPKHVSYINAPARYLWDRTHDVLERATGGLFGRCKNRYLRSTFHKLRTWDSEAAGRADVLLAASKDVQRRIELYWRRDSEVIYPPIDDYWLEDSPNVPSSSSAKKRFIIASTLVPYKRIDRAIRACTLADVELTIVGEGPQKKALQRNAGKHVTFLGYVDRDQLKKLLSESDGLIIPGEEDFGLTPLEAMACGTPVVSLRAGGPLETIIEGTTGAFFDKPTDESLAEVLRSWDKSQFNAQACKARAAEFSRARFEKAIRVALAKN